MQPPVRTSSVTDRWSIQSNESSSTGRPPSTSSTNTPETVLGRKSDAIVLAENQPVELGSEVVRSEGSSWDDVAELEAGRTKNLLARWKATEQEYAVPKTSTTRFVLCDGKLFSWNSIVMQRSMLRSHFIVP
jgi:hypothetical protein